MVALLLEKQEILHFTSRSSSPSIRIQLYLHSLPSILQRFIMSEFTPINENIKVEDLGDAPEASVAPKTPKRKNAAQGGTPKKPKNDTPKSTGRNIKASIPETFDELAEQDKMLIEWKEVSTTSTSYC